MKFSSKYIRNKEPKTSNLDISACTYHIQLLVRRLKLKTIQKCTLVQHKTTEHKPPSHVKVQYPLTNVSVLKPGFCTHQIIQMEPTSEDIKHVLS